MAEIPLSSTAGAETPELIIEGVVGAGLEIYRVAGGSLSATFDGVALDGLRALSAAFGSG